LFLIKHHTNEGVWQRGKMQLCTFLSLQVDEDEWTALCPGCFTPVE